MRRSRGCPPARTTISQSPSRSPNWWPGCGLSGGGQPRPRPPPPPPPPVLRSGDVELDPARRMVTRAGTSVELTRKEFGVLEVLISAAGTVVSSEELLERVWDENADPFTTTVRVTVMTLRRKLGEPALIDTVVGAGYRVSSTPV